MSAVNFSEVIAKLSEQGVPEDAIHEALDSLELDIVDFAIKRAYQTGLLRPLTKHASLSLGDCACLALSQQLNLPALTTDRVWKDIALNITVEVIH